jgi:hypothetical protein
MQEGILALRNTGYSVASSIMARACSLQKMSEAGMGRLHLDTDSTSPGRNLVLEGGEQKNTLVMMTLITYILFDFE